MWRAVRLGRYSSAPWGVFFVCCFIRFWIGFLFLVVCLGLGRLSMSLAGCYFCHSVVPVRPVRPAMWGCLSSVFPIVFASIILPSVLAHPFGWGRQRHAPPFETCFGWASFGRYLACASRPCPAGLRPRRLQSLIK